MRNTLETRLGVFVALAVIAAVVLIEIVGGIERFEPGYRLTASFATVQDLQKGARVKMAGVEIGRVEDIRLESTNNKVLVTLKLRKDALVRTDSVATIKFTGLLGQNFIAIDFGTPNSPIATEGAMLASAEQPDLSAMMARVDEALVGVQNLTKSFTGEKIDNLLGPFTDFLTANREPLTATIANMQAVSSQIAKGKGTVGKLIYEDTLHNSAYSAVTNLQDASTELKLTIADAHKVVNRINAGDGTVGLLLQDESLYREATDSMTNLREILQKMNQGQGTVGKIINDEDLYKNAKMTLQKLDKATEGLEDQGPLSVIGILFNNLF
jgi:phospholipid/cholesterol/gamma-HCH transport system substrate-binding protein